MAKMSKNDSENLKEMSNDTVAFLKEAMKNPKEIKARLKKFIDDEAKGYDGEIKQVKQLAGYLTSNWKKVLPTVAALALAGHMIKNKSKKAQAATKTPMKSKAKAKGKAKPKTAAKKKAK